MKTLKRILLIIAGICLIIACSKSDHFWGDEPLGYVYKVDNAKPIMVTVPFKMEGTLAYEKIEVDESFCGEDYPIMRVIASGPSMATHLGKVNVIADFCSNFITGIFGVPNPALVKVVAGNGDVLLISTMGEVFLREEDDPPYVLEKWVAPFSFAGGTGRFEGATGEGKYIGYNYMNGEAYICHAIFEGTLTTVKGK